MRRLLLFLGVAVLVVALTLTFTVPVFAHVHAITPLDDCGKANVNAGGNGTIGTPADEATGGPIKGLIPRNLGKAPLTAEDGGFGATAGNCP